MSDSETKSDDAQTAEKNDPNGAVPPASETRPPSGDQARAPASTPPASAASDAKAEAPPPESAATAAPDPLEAAKAEAQKFREQLLRTAADFDNFRKRTRREHEDAQRRGKEAALKELLPVFDNLERATASAETAPDVKSVADGLRMVNKQFLSTLDRLGIKRVATIGQPFDPALHEAIQHIESKEHPAGVIAAEVQAGYLYGEHLIRAALVAVSKGPPAEAAPPADGAPPAETPTEPEVN
jgi:molecular chaperone GrpE